MEKEILYKYLDADGGLKMLQYHNLQFTNATKLNDPFDCHPSLFDFSNVPKEQCGLWKAQHIVDMKLNKLENQRNRTWLCSLSKVYESLLMWSYYNNHKGVCIGIDMEKANSYLSQIIGSTVNGALKLEVQYKEIIDKPNLFKDDLISIFYQFETKAKAWEHEKEVRLILMRPILVPYRVPEEFINKKNIDQKEKFSIRKVLSRIIPNENSNVIENNDPIDCKEIRYYPPIGEECFTSVYLGVNINQKKRGEIIREARKINPNIKIYQMNVDSNAFKLYAVLIE